jgi:hypothetical protein
MATTFIHRKPLTMDQNLLPERQQFAVARRPRLSCFHRRAFGLADRDHLFCMRARQLAAAGQSTALPDGGEILAHFFLSLRDHRSQRCIISRLRCDYQRSKSSAWVPKSGVALALHPQKPVSEVSDQLAAAALARARRLQAARKAFISARSTIIRVATPLYFFVAPVIVRLTAPRWTRP